MFEKFTDRARRAVVLANEGAKFLKFNYIGTEHILLGLVHEGEGTGAQILVRRGVDLMDLRRTVEETIGLGTETTPVKHLPFNPRSKKTLELSNREAIDLEHSYIATGHILLGLIREREGVAAQVLSNFGVDLDNARRELLTFPNEESEARASPRTRAESARSGAAMDGQQIGGVFLSYRREDSGHVAGRIADKLADRFGDERIFVDVDSIGIGVDFREAISDALNKCSVLLAIIGRDWLTVVDEDGSRKLELEDDLVRFEVQTALDRKIITVPILVDGAANLRARDLPAKLSALAYRNSTSLRHETFREDLRKLMVGLERILG